MLTWLANNLGSILVALVLLIIVGAIVWNMRKEKQQGKSSCSHGCDHCALHGQCHAGAKAK